MTELLQIQEPGRVKLPAPQWAAFLELGFRPLYLAGCFWAAVSVALWVFAPVMLRGQLAGVIWHAHEMLWGFIATIGVTNLIGLLNYRVGLFVVERQLGLADTGVYSIAVVVAELLWFV